jgi:MoaA/NifB/PqqE/SkfB family radical SAM enzyme
LKVGRSHSANPIFLRKPFDMGDLALPFVLPRIGDQGLEVVKYVNFLQAMESRRRRALRIACLPIDLTVDFTTTCQLSCPYCAVGNGTMKRGSSLMDISLYRRLVAELSDTSFVTWYFSTGEPLLHKGLTDLLDLEKGKDVFSSISTNLSMPLSDDRIDSLLICGLKQISVSLDGASSGTYARYRVGGRFDLVVRNLIRLVRRKRELGLRYPLIEWRFLLFEHNGHEIETTMQLAGEIGVDLLEFFPGSAPAGGAVRPYHGAAPPRPVLGPALDEGLARRETALQRHLADANPWPGAAADLIDQPRKCDWHYLGGMIYPDGAVGPCCVSVDAHHDFGMLGGEMTYQTVIDNHCFQAARRSFVTGEPSNTICDTCPAPPAQHFQFTQKIRAILRLAPDWALTILEANPDRFFYRTDGALMPAEVGCLAARTAPIDRSLEPLRSWIASKAAGAYPALRAQAERFAAMTPLERSEASA